jgi:hypothetical protein
MFPRALWGRCTESRTDGGRKLYRVAMPAYLPVERRGVRPQRMIVHDGHLHAFDETGGSTTDWRCDRSPDALALSIRWKRRWKKQSHGVALRRSNPQSRPRRIGSLIPAARRSIATWSAILSPLTR